MLPVFNCVPTIEVICTLMSIHLRSASQQHLVIALTILSTIKIHMVPYKYTREAFLQFPTLAGESLKWNILAVTWALVICLKYTHLHSGCALALAYISGKSLMPMLQLLFIPWPLGICLIYMPTPLGRIV